MYKDLITGAARLHGYRIYKNLLMESQYWPQERLDGYVLTHLRRTLIRAWQGTEFYRSQFREAGFDPRTDLRSASDISKLPVLTKDVVRSRGQSLVDKRFLLGSVVAHTSGTTGQPLKMRLGEWYVAFDFACIFRQYSWAGYTFRAPMAAIRSYVPVSEDRPLWRYSRPKNILYFSAYHLTPSNCQQYLNRLLEFRPQFIRGYASSAALLAEYAYPIREQLSFVKGIFTASETLLPGERDAIEATFGRRLFNWYGMTEPVLVITECDAHSGMHINAEYGYYEFLPSDDLGPNEFRLVATSLHNPVMPFIRYETGDVVRLLTTSEGCPCGRTLPLIDTVMGRKDECIITPDGRRLPSVNFYTVFRKYADILRFQIVQYGRSEIVVKINLRPNAGNPQGLVDSLHRELAVRFGPQVTLEVEITERFITNSDGKTQSIVRKLGSRSTEEREEYMISSQAAWQLERKGRRVYKLDWNESECAPSPAVLDALQKLLRKDSSVCWYPEARDPDLTERVAAYAGVPENSILLTHGSDLGMELLATCFAERQSRVLVLFPNYDNFRAVFEQRGALSETFVYDGSGAFPLEGFVAAVRAKSPRVVYLSNPNNPIGYSLDHATLDHIAEACARLSTVLVIDEAYYEFCGITATDLVTKYKNIVVLRSFSKAFGMAGLRLGFLVASPGIVRLLLRVDNPKSVTTFAKAAATAVLGDLARVQEYVRKVNAAKELYYAFFNDRGIKHFRSDGNFILFRDDKPRELIEFLKGKNILIRDRSAYFNGVGHVRITVTSVETAKIVIAAISEYYKAATPLLPPKMDESLSYHTSGSIDCDDRPGAPSSSLPNRV